MTTGRTARRLRARSRRRRTSLMGAGVVGLVAVVAVLVGLGIGAARDKDLGRVTPSVALPGDSANADVGGGSATTTSSGIPVEVPNVTGMVLEQADTLLAAAGFRVVSVATPAGEKPDQTVLSQEPAAGTVLSSGSDVTLTYASDSPVVAATIRDPGAPSATTRYTVCLDPGHQAVANLDGEPIGPGATEVKPKVTAGAVGTVTGQTEHELTLAIAMLVKSSLEREGVRVVMTRTTSAVDISNAQRAQIANQAGADLFVRIHADANTNGDVRGVGAMYPGGNAWVEPIVAASKRAASVLHSAVIHATGASDRGIVERADLSGFNYCEVPATLIECGFLSSPSEDKLMTTDAYRAKLAAGLTEGIMAYLESAR